MMLHTMFGLVRLCVGADISKQNRLGLLFPSLFVASTMFVYRFGVCGGNSDYTRLCNDVK